MACICRSELNDRLKYENGSLTWKLRTLETCRSKHQMNAWNARYGGVRVKEYTTNSGYKVFRINGRHILSHRAIYMMHFGQIDNEIDHVNGDKLDNSLSNLRQATSSQNGINSKPRGGSSHYRGVYFNKKDRRWRAQASISGTVKYIGNFLTEADAAKAYNQFALAHYDRRFLRLNEVTV